MTERAAGRLSSAAGCTEPTTRRSPAVTTTQSTRLPQPWRCSSAVRAGGRTKAIAPRPVRARFDAGQAKHAASRRRTAASMNRRPSRALAHGPAAEVGANASRSLAAAAPPREVPRRVSVGRRDGQRIVDSRGDATVRRRDRDDRCSSNATTPTPTSCALAMPCKAAAPARRRLVAASGREHQCAVAPDRCCFDEPPRGLPACSRPGHAGLSKHHAVYVGRGCFASPSSTAAHAAPASSFIACGPPDRCSSLASALTRLVVVHSRSQGRVRADAPSPARAEARTFAGSR